MTSADVISQKRAEDETPARASAAVPQLLVIDDDPTHRMVIVRLAQKLGYATVESSTVLHAVDMITTRHFDCMTLDLHMGAQYGAELLSIMNSQQPNVPVVVISSAGNDERWEVLRTASLYGIRIAEVPKPLDVGMLRDVFMEIRDVV